MHFFLLASGVRDLFAADAELHATDQVISEVTFLCNYHACNLPGGKQASKWLRGEILLPPPVVLDSEGHPLMVLKKGYMRSRTFGNTFGTATLTLTDRVSYRTGCLKALSGNLSNVIRGFLRQKRSRPEPVRWQAMLKALMVGRLLTSPCSPSEPVNFFAIWVCSVAADKSGHLFGVMFAKSISEKMLVNQCSHVDQQTFDWNIYGTRFGPEVDPSSCAFAGAWWCARPRWVATALKEVMTKLDAGAPALALDYAKCFDHVDPKLVILHLRLHKWPGALVSLLEHVWLCQQRYLQLCR
jgi:hypothetical protein